jgi:hypothetical protein
MRSLPLALLRVILIAACAAGAIYANDRVVVVSNADERYTEEKFGEGETKRETYVVMQGRYHSGTTIDRSLERMTFKEIASYLVPRLAEQQYVPAKSVPEADLLLVVHWGVTNPRASRMEMTGDTTHYTPSVSLSPEAGASPDEADRVAALNGLLGGDDRAANFDIISDYAEAERSDRDLAQLLGYGDALRKLTSRVVTSTDEQTLRSDLERERYFIILRAYELRTPTEVRPRRPVWTMNLNISSAGNNFRTAMGRMSFVAPNFVGRTLEDVKSIRAKTPKVEVELGDLIIMDAAP